MTWVYLLKEKVALSSVLQFFYMMILTQFGVSIQKFRTCNAQDYFNHTLNQFFQQKGILHQSSCVDSPQQNGVTERKMRHLLNVIRALLHQRSVPKTFWGETVLTATHLINRVPSRVLGNLSPHHCLATHFSALSLYILLSHLRFLGA